MKVTGPGGANPITDAQIAELRSLAAEAGEGLIIGERFCGPAAVLILCDEATGELDYAATLERRLWSRNRLAEAWNERNGSTP